MRRPACATRSGPIHARVAGRSTAPSGLRRAREVRRAVLRAPPESRLSVRVRTVRVRLERCSSTRPVLALISSTRCAKGGGNSLCERRGRVYFSSHFCVLSLGFKFYLFRFPVSRSRRCARWPAPRIPRAQARAHAPRAARKVREGTFPHGGDATSILYGIKP